MSHKKLYFDIETEGLPQADIEKFMPTFEAPGNIKDPAKIAAAIAEKKADWLDKAALRAITGRIVAVSYAWDDNKPAVFVNDDEAGLIQSLYSILEEAVAGNDRAYSWNGHGFDLPFFCQRAAVYDIPAFMMFTVPVRGRFYWNEFLIDPKLVWSNYSSDHSGTSLNSVALALGVGSKTDDGKHFGELLKTDPAAALAYAANDITLLRGIVKRMWI